MQIIGRAKDFKQRGKGLPGWLYKLLQQSGNKIKGLTNSLLKTEVPLSYSPPHYGCGFWGCVFGWPQDKAIKITIDRTEAFAWKYFLDLQKGRRLSGLPEIQGVFEIGEIHITDAAARRRHVKDFMFNKSRKLPIYLIVRQDAPPVIEAKTELPIITRDILNTSKRKIYELIDAKNQNAKKFFSAMSQINKYAQLAEQLSWDDLDWDEEQLSVFYDELIESIENLKQISYSRELSYLLGDLANKDIFLWDLTADNIGWVGTNIVMTDPGGCEKFLEQSQIKKIRL